VQPDLDDLLAQPGDVLLLTSDGLTRHVPDELILQIVQSTPDLQVACGELIAAAKDAGGRDNITCVLLRFVEQSWFKKVLSIFGWGGSPQWQNSI
jgi:serine/threonine protein phosphatase PrpC